MCIAHNFPVFLRASVVLGGSSGTKDGPLCLVTLNRATEIAEDASSSMAVEGGRGRARTRHADLQLPAMCIDSTLKEIEGITKYFEKYKNEGFTSSLSIAKVIANEMDVDPLFPIKRRVTSNEKIVRYIPYNSVL